VYGQCVLKNYTATSKDMCLKEFMELKNCVQRNVSNCFWLCVLVCWLTGVYLARKKVVIKRLHVYIPEPIYFTYWTRSACLDSTSFSTNFTYTGCSPKFLLERYCGLWWPRYRNPSKVSFKALICYRETWFSRWAIGWALWLNQSDCYQFFLLLFYQNIISLSHWTQKTRSSIGEHDVYSVLKDGSKRRKI
jgi:hypothetical protein